MLRLHSSEFEEIIEGLLYKLGRLEQPINHLPGIALFYKYRRHDPKLHKIAVEMQELYVRWLKFAIEKATREQTKLLDPTPYLIQADARHERLGLDMAMEMISAHAAFQMRSPWGAPCETPWRDIIELRDLFHSEKLDAYYGRFFDQRYIDYLHRNEEDLDRIHWRKFEQLTAEYLNREGYQVELGPGRGDDGVDVRAWRTDNDKCGTPQVIVQCKRQKATVEKVVVKALYADVLAEAADTGMIVTTSRLSEGAEATRTARNYPVVVADRVTLRTWLEQLRKPGAGIVM
jgi:restriction system protein